MPHFIKLAQTLYLTEESLYAHICNVLFLYLDFCSEYLHSQTHKWPTLLCLSYLVVMWTVLHEVPATIEINRMMGLFSPPGFPLFNLKTETTAGDEHEMCSYISRKVHIRVWRRVSERFAVTIYLRHRLTRSINHL